MHRLGLQTRDVLGAPGHQYCETDRRRRADVRDRGNANADAWGKYLGRRSADSSGIREHAHRDCRTRKFKRCIKPLASHRDPRRRGANCGVRNCANLVDLGPDSNGSRRVWDWNNPALGFK